MSAGVEGTEEIEAILAQPELRRAIDQASVITGTDLRIGEVAGVVVVLAAFSLVHALVLSTSRNRLALATLKGLGFTRGQVGGAVAVLATRTLCSPRSWPFRSAWPPVGGAGGFVADSIGVPPVPVIPWVVMPAVVLGMALVGNLAAAYPAWRAARLPTASALRAE